MQSRGRRTECSKTVVWLTGLSGSGKSAIAYELDRQLLAAGVSSYVLDGDKLRQGLNRDLGFSDEDRQENIRRLGEVAWLFADAGFICIVAAISPFRADRELVRSRIGPESFVEVHVNCPLEECERRDPKELYKKARSGLIPLFTGISSPYEAPCHPELVLETRRQSIQESVGRLIHYLQQHGHIPVWRSVEE